MHTLKASIDSHESIRHSPPTKSPVNRLSAAPTRDFMDGVPWRKKMDDPSDFDVDLAKLSGQHFSAKYLAIMLLGESIRRCDKDVFNTLANRIDDEMFAFRVEHQAHGHGLSLLDFASSVLSDSASAQPEAASLERRRSEIFRFIADYCAKRFGIADVSSGISG